MNDPTTSFLAMLAFYSTERTLMDRYALRAVCESPAPINPLEASRGPGTTEDEFAAHQGFDYLLRSEAVLDWKRIQREAARLEKFLKRQDDESRQAQSDTRWITLLEKNPYFDFLRWADAWSRRDLESVVGFFSEDAVWIDRTLGVWAPGKRELRECLARFLHSFEGKMKVESAKLAPEEGEIDLLWVRTGSRIPGQDFENLGSGEVRGQSNVWLEDGLISMCLEGTNVKDLERIAMASWGRGRAGGSGTVTETETMVTVDDVRLLKTFRFKKDFPVPHDGGNQ
jgi:hypothetical protein